MERYKLTYKFELASGKMSKEYVHFGTMLYQASRKDGLVKYWQVNVDGSSHQINEYGFPI